MSDIPTPNVVRQFEGVLGPFLAEADQMATSASNLGDLHGKYASANSKMMLEVINLNYRTSHLAGAVIDLVASEGYLRSAIRGEVEWEKFPRPGDPSEYPFDGVFRGIVMLDKVASFSSTAKQIGTRVPTNWSNRYAVSLKVSQYRAGLELGYSQFYIPVSAVTKAPAIDQWHHVEQIVGESAVR